MGPEFDAAYPQRWIGKVTVLSTDGRTLHGRVEETKGDPGNTLSREEITAKAPRLIAYECSAGRPHRSTDPPMWWRACWCASTLRAPPGMRMTYAC